jgi:hypothetical protein
MLSDTYSLKTNEYNRPLAVMTNSNTIRFSSGKQT